VSHRMRESIHIQSKICFHETVEKEKTEGERKQDVRKGEGDYWV
jgi:hypothetical protein